MHIAGRCHEAKEEHEKELAISEALEDTIGSAVACRKIGECYCGMDQYDKALQFQQRHLELSRSCGNLLEEQRALATIGRTYLFQCDSARGKQNIVKASKQAEEAFCKSLTACENLKQEVKNVEYMEMKARLYLNLGWYIFLSTCTCSFKKRAVAFLFTLLALLFYD